MEAKLRRPRFLYAVFNCDGEFFNSELKLADQDIFSNTDIKDLHSYRF